MATFSRRMRLQLVDGCTVDARIRGKRLRPVCGDRVRAVPIPGEPDWLITAIAERDNALTRPHARDGVEILAANIDLLIVVASAEPAPDWFVVDRYLCAAETMRVAALVAFNKSDLGVPYESLQEYRDAGYTTVTCSAVSGAGIDSLLAAIGDRTAILVGQSGGGKSSLINELHGGRYRKTAPISAKTGAGRHTTVNSMLLQLPRGGRVIDSPGVRDYTPKLRAAADVATGFREIAAAAQNCRFANCRHVREPDCAVKAAVGAGRISSRRFASYKRSLHML